MTTLLHSYSGGDKLTLIVDCVGVDFIRKRPVSSVG